jgi:hypothetical protein
VVLRTKINTFDRYILGIGEIGMVKSTEDVKVYFITMPAHTFLHIKIYGSKGYFDFWEKQKSIPGQNCDTICGLPDGIKGKPDGKDTVIGRYSGQIMAHIYEGGGKVAEAYGVRLPVNFNGEVPVNMLLIDIPEMEYIVFEHGPFNYDEESDTVGEKLQEAINTFDFSRTEYKPDTAAGRVAYFYFVPESFEKRIRPVIKKWEAKTGRKY